MTVLLIPAPGYRILNMTQISLISLLQIQPAVFEDLITMFDGEELVWILSLLPWLKGMYTAFWGVLIILSELGFITAIIRYKWFLVGILSLQGLFAGLFLGFFVLVKCSFYSLLTTPAAQNDPLLFTGIQKIILSLSGWGKCYLLMVLLTLMTGIWILLKTRIHGLKCIRKNSQAS